MILATLQGQSFGQGVHQLAAVENALVLCLLALLIAVLLLTALFIRQIRRRPPLLSDETARLLDELAAPPGPRSIPPLNEAAWERPADWWKSGDRAGDER